MDNLICMKCYLKLESKLGWVVIPPKNSFEDDLCDFCGAVIANDMDAAIEFEETNAEFIFMANPEQFDEFMELIDNGWDTGTFTAIFDKPSRWNEAQ